MSFIHEEKRICNLFNVDETAIRKSCINKFMTEAGHVIYIATRRICPDNNCSSCDSVWSNDIMYHNHVTGVCTPCQNNKLILMAQAEFVSLHWKKITRESIYDYPEYKNLRLGSTLCGGNPRTLFDTLELIQEKAADSSEERNNYKV